MALTHVALGTLYAKLRSTIVKLKNCELHAFNQLRHHPWKVLAELRLGPVLDPEPLHFILI